MIKKRQSYSLLLFKTTKTPPKQTLTSTTSKTLLNPPPETLINHKSLCFSLIEKLIHANLIPSAQQVVRQMIAQSSSLPDDLSKAIFSISRGVDLDLTTCGLFIRELITSNQLKVAESLYHNQIVNRGIKPSFDITNSMVICYCKSGKFDEALLVFDKLMRSDDSVVHCKVAVNYILRGLFQRARFLEAFDVVSRVNVRLGFWCYNVLIDRLCQTGYLNEAIEVFSIMRDRTGPSSPTLHLYKSLFYGFCKGGRFEEAEKVFVEMGSQGFYVDRAMYTCLIKAYFMGNKMNMAMEVYQRMVKTGCEPDEVTYQILISNYCRNGELDCARMILRTMINNNLTPSVRSYTVLIAALCKENRLRDVKELLKDFCSQRVVSDHILYFILKRNLPKENSRELAFQFLQEIASHVRGFDFSSVFNTSDNLEWKIESMLEDISRIDLDLANMAFAILINALCEMEQIDTALGLFDKMTRLGCTPLLFTYNSLIKCLCQEGFSELVESVLAKMQSSGMAPDMNTYLITVNAYCKRGDLDLAFNMLNKMDEKGLKPNVAIYDSIISCLSKKKRIFDAEDMLKRMLKDGLDPDEKVLTTMINGYFMNGMALEAQELFEEMIKFDIKPSSYSYTALVSGLVKDKLIDRACHYLKMMLRDGYQPNVVLYTSLINSFSRVGDFGFAWRLADLMVNRNQIEQDLIHYVTLVSGVSRNIVSTKRRYERTKERLFHLLNRVALVPRKNILKVITDSPQGMKGFAVKLIQQVKETTFMPNLYLYNSMIYGFVKADKIEDAYLYFESMQREGIRPNEVTFTILIGKHIRDGEIDRAIDLFNKMNANGCIPDRTAYNTLLKGLCNLGRLQDAFSLLHTMQKRGLFPYRVSYEKILNYFCDNKMSGPAFKIFEEMLSHHYVPGKLSRDWLLCLLCDEKKLEEALFVYYTMREREKLFKESTISLLMQLCDDQYPEESTLDAKDYRLLAIAW